MAQESAVAFPIVVSEEDAYPGVGNVNKEQTVKSGWLLPIRTDVPQKIVLTLNASVGGKVIAINCKSAKIAAGGLPQGVSFQVGDDGALRLSGTPTKKGYTAATFQIVTTHSGTVSKPVGVMVADTAHATILPTQEVFLTAEKHDSLGTYVWLNDGKRYEIPLAFTSQHVNTFLLRKYSGYLPYTLTYDAEGEGETRWRIVSTNGAFDLHFATPPGLYEATMELITYPGGDVYRLPVSIAVAPGYTQKWEKEYSVRRYDPMANVFSEWKEKAGCIKSIAITSGSLPKGVTLRNSYYYPFGLYGAPMETGDFTAQVRVTSDNNAHDYTITIHVEDVPKITGTVKLTYPGDHPFAGEDIQAVLTDVPTPNKIQWEDSSDGVEYTETKTTGATYKTNPKFTGKAYIRAKVTATGYGGALYSDPTYLTEALDLTGGISYLTGVAMGQQIKTQLTGTLGSIYYSLAPEIVHFQWQASEDGSSGWSDIPGATEKSYTPAESDAGMYLRLKAAADRYNGEVYSAARQLAQTAWTVDPEKPYLTIASPYDAVTVTNAKANQEYAVSYAYNTVDWTHSTYPDADGALSLPAEKDRTVYVYTRMRKTAAHPAGAKNECRSIYNGYTTALAGLVLDHTTVTTKVGEVTVLTVSPLPEEFEGWNDSYTVKWGTSGSGVTLFANAACFIPVTLGTPSSHKTVYAKGTAASNHCQVSVEKQVGYTDLRRAVCDFAVADASGNFNLEYLNFDEVILMPGETATVGYTTHPSPALVGVLSFKKTEGPGDLTLTANGDGTVSVSAPHRRAQRQVLL